MRESVHPVELSRELLAGNLRDSFRGVIHAADGIQDPDLVARANAASRAPIAVERRRRRTRKSSWRRLIGVARETVERRLEIVRVHPCPSRNALGRNADGKPILHDRYSRRMIGESDFVAGRHVST